MQHELVIFSKKAFHLSGSDLARAQQSLPGEDSRRMQRSCKTEYIAGHENALLFEKKQGAFCHKFFCFVSFLSFFLFDNFCVVLYVVDRKMF